MNPEFAEYMPDTVSFRELRSSIRLGKELNRIVNQLKRGGKASAFRIAVSPSGTVTTAYELHEAQINYRVEEQRKARARARMGIRAGSAEARIHVIDRNPLKPEQMTRNQMRRLDERVRKASATTPTMRAASMYSNYLDAMRAAGFAQEFPGEFETVERIIREIMENDPEYLVEVYESNIEELQIDWVYDDLQEMEARMRYILRGWEEAYAEYQLRRL